MSLANLPIELAVLDVAGTTLEEGGTVYRVLAETVRTAGGDPDADQIEAWMGASKREAIQALLTAGGADASDPVVDAAFRDFRSRLRRAYAEKPPAPFAGVPEVIARLRAAGIKVALTTGFDRDTTSSLLTSAGWTVGGVLDAVICIDDVTTGRPAPFMIFHAMEATGVTDVRRVLVAGDTVRDVESGLNAGAGMVVAVQTGEVKADTLAAARPTHLLGGVVDIPSLPGLLP
jgi:phosphonatase-like hydrolase